MISRIKTFFSSFDVAQLLLTALLLKLIITSSISFPESFVILGLMIFIGTKFYFVNVKLKPLSDNLEKELAEIKSKVNKVENDYKQVQTQVKPPTQRIWG